MANPDKLPLNIPVPQQYDPATVWKTQYRPQRVHIVGTHSATLQEMVNGKWVDVRPLKIRKEDGKYSVSLSEEVE